MPSIQERYLALRRQIIDDFFTRMNPMQREAVYAVEGSVLILAGAGSGKTTVIINRIANMIQFGDAYTSREVPQNLSEADVSFLEEYAAGDNWEMEKAFQLIRHRPIMPWNVLAITFTNKAAGELRDRLEAMLGATGSEVNASTFHSCCARILRREIEALGYGKSFTIYDTDDSLRVIKGALKEMNITEKQFSPKSILAAMGRAKDTLQTPEEFAKAAGDDYRLQVVSKVYTYYQRQLRSANAVDFDDIIMLTVQLFRQFPQVLDYYRNRFRYVLVDEYQDTNHAQFELVRLLSGESKNLCVVGDDDQSIYKFRGATIENILQFEETYPGTKVIRLEQNYRSTGIILDAANQVISNNTQRKGKTLWTENGTGEKIQVYRAKGEREEARFICENIKKNMEESGEYKNNVILYRMNAQSQVLEQEMVHSDIPYRIIGGLRFYDRKEIRDVVAYLSVINNPSDTLRLRRIINEPKRKIGDSTVNLVLEIAQDEGISAFAVMEKSETYPALERRAAGLIAFTGMMRELMQAAETGPLDALIDLLLDKTGYMDMLRSEGFEGQTRIENVEELKSTMLRYGEDHPDGSLAGFLEEISLYTEIDRYNASDDTVVMMTMHAAKGLEFDNVFIAGMEDGIFPGVQAIYDQEQKEEERRLAYVSLTRAKKRLYISNAAQRMMFGQTMRNRPSLFLKEIPVELCEVEDTTVTRRVAQKDMPAKKEKSHFAGSSGLGQAQRTAQDYATGDAVSHNKFGEGVIVSVTPMGNDKMLEISFGENGTKKLMAAFAPLKKE